MKSLGTPEEIREPFAHFLIDTYDGGDVSLLTETKEEASKLLFDEVFQIVRAVKGRIFWRVFPEVDHIVSFDPPGEGWKGYTRFSIEVGVDGAGVVRENDPSKYPYLSFVGLV